MSRARIKGHLTSRIGKTVTFGPPRDVFKAGGKSTAGKIIDEVWVNKDLNSTPPRQGDAHNSWGDYSFCAQLIDWGQGERGIRFAYYRRRIGEDWWELGSQTTVCSDPVTIKRLCELTLSKRTWYSV